jgi:hypothetical protein
MTGGDLPASANGTADAYLLRNLIWCELCNMAMMPLLLGGARYYECDNEACPRPIPAAGMELLIWRQYALLYEGTGKVLPTAMRREALRRTLKRVRVGEDLFEFWCEWKD